MRLQIILRKAVVGKQRRDCLRHYFIIEILTTEYIISLAGAVVKPSVGLDTAINQISAQPPKLFRSCSEVFSEIANIIDNKKLMFRVIQTLSIFLDINTNSRLLSLM